MIQLWLDDASAAEALLAVHSSTLVRINECLPRQIERKLGYFGQARFVFFYLEPRGEEVVWNDGRSYGFGCGAWLAFLDEIAPLGRRQGVDLGSMDRRGSHVLLLDRKTRRAHFADRATAESMTVRQDGNRAA